MFKSENIGTIAKALVKAQKEMGSAVKDAKNPYFKSNYADLSAVIDAAVPVLNQNGIAVLQLPTTVSVTNPDNGYGGASKAVLRTVLLHESGEFLGSDTDIVAAKANDPQAYGSAISYARRYGLQAAVTLKSADDDGEASMGRGSKGAVTITGVKADGTLTVDNNKTIDIAAVGTEGTGKKRVSFARKTAAAPVAAASTEDDI